MSKQLIDYYGTIENASKLFKYLMNRRQRDAIKFPNIHENIYSKYSKVQHGVPQGCVLGLLLLSFVY
jgi:hypothetical protein